MKRLPARKEDIIQCHFVLVVGVLCKLQLVVKMIKSGVLALNIAAALFYCLLGGLLLFVLKRANRPLTRFEGKQKQKDRQKQEGEAERAEVDYNKMIAVSYLKKYTLIGSCFQEDKKYLLKEFLFVSVYAVASLNINHVIMWPVALSLALLPVVFLLWDVALKAVESKLKESSENKINIEQKGESQLQLDVGNIEPRVNIIRTDHLEQVKINTKTKRNLVEIGVLTAVGFISLVMLLQAVMTLGTSVSNSGQLNIISLLIAVGIDQLGLRIVLGAAVWTTCKVLMQVASSNNQESVFVSLLCHEELTHILIEEEKERLRKEQERIRRELEMIASPPRKKTLSPSRVPKAPLSVERQNYLNLVNLQPTIRNDQDEVIEEIEFTSAEKDLFESPQNKSGFYTKRLRSLENRGFSQSANRGTTIDVNEKRESDDLFILKKNPLKELENIQSGQFFLEDSEVRQTKRRGYNRKKNRRNLKLTGNSPYLEYLPDMLKKVDQFKSINTTGKESKDCKEAKERKLL